MATDKISLKTPSNGITIAATATDILWLGAKAGTPFADITCGAKRIREVTALFDVTAATLTNLSVFGKLAGSDIWVPMAVAAADYVPGGSPYVRHAATYTKATNAYVDNDLASIAADDYGVLILTTPGFDAIKFTAIGNGANVAAALHGYEFANELAESLILYDANLIAAIAVIGTPLQRDPGEFAEGTIALNGPLDGDTITFDLGGASETVFEFDLDPPGVVGTNIAVAIGLNDNQTMDNLEVAIETNLPFGVICTGSGCTITALTAGIAGNLTIIESTAAARITVTGMAGGVDPVTSLVLGQRLAAIEGNVAAYTTGGIGTANADAAATSYALGSQACRAMILTAKSTNTGLLWIAVGATAVSGQGTPLAAGDRIGVAVSNTSMVRYLADTIDDDLCYNWVN